MCRIRKVNTNHTVNTCKQLPVISHISEQGNCVDVQVSVPETNGSNLGHMYSEFCDVSVENKWGSSIAGTSEGDAYHLDNYLVDKTCEQGENLEQIVLLNGSISVAQNVSDCNQSSLGNNVAHNESQLKNQLCTCVTQGLDWCFVHSKVTRNMLMDNKVCKDFGFIVNNFIEWPLFKPPTVLESGDLIQWVFDAHTLVKASSVVN